MGLLGTLTCVWGLRPEVVLWTLELGRYRSGNEYYSALKEAGMLRWEDDYVRYSLVDNPRFVCEPKRTEIDLVVLTVDGDFGYKKGACWGDINRDRRRFGLELCPPEVGPALRLAYRVQPREEKYLDIAMEPLVCSRPLELNGSPDKTYDYSIVWSLQHRYSDRTLMLMADTMHLAYSIQHPWNDDFLVSTYQRLVFVKPRPKGGNYG
jgi:hypothetical protein